MITGEQLKKRLDDTGQLKVAIQTLDVIKERLEKVGVTDLKEEPGGKGSVKLTYASTQS